MQQHYTTEILTHTGEGEGEADRGNMHTVTTKTRLTAGLGKARRYLIGQTADGGVKRQWDKINHPPHLVGLGVVGE